MPGISRVQVAGMGFHYLYYPLDYFLDIQRKLGFKSIEMNARAPHFLLDSYGFQDTGELKKKVESYGLSIGVFTPESVSYPYLLCAHDPVAQKNSLEYYKNAIRAAGGTGAKYMPVSCCGGDWNEESERVFERAAATLRILGDIAADNGVTIAVETLNPEESRIVNTLSELQRLLKEVAHPNVKAALDLTAMNMAGETMRQWFSALGNDIVHCHFVDGRPSGRLVWGDGLLPLEDCVQVLNDNNYQGYLGLKITDGRYLDDPEEADRRNMSALKPYLV